MLMDLWLRRNMLLGYVQCSFAVDYEPASIHIYIYIYILILYINYLNFQYKKFIQAYIPVLDQRRRFWDSYLLRHPVRVHGAITRIFSL